jgi:hypothetical protein
VHRAERWTRNHELDLDLLSLPDFSGLTSVQRRARQLLARPPWPDSSDEDWRYTPWSALLPPEWGGQEARAPESVSRQLPLVEFPQSCRPYWESDGFLLLAQEDREGFPTSNLRVTAGLDGPVAPWLDSIVEKSKDRFDALALATLRRVVWIQVPGQSAFGGPLVIVRPESDGLWDSTATRVDLGAGSRGTLLVLDGHPRQDGVDYGVDLTEIRLERGAQWTVVFLQVFGPASRRLQRARLVFDSGAEAQLVRLDLGGAIAKVETTLHFAGEGAKATFRGIVILSRGQHVEVDTLQNHAARGNRSDLLVKSVIGDRSVAIHRGRIWIHKDAHGSDAYQANRNVLLSHEGRVHSIPMLDIEANDVRCSHGSATGPLDEQQVFYLRTRGLSEVEARRLILQGFLLAELESSDLGRWSSALEAAMTAKLDSVLAGSPEGAEAQGAESL